MPRALVSVTDKSGLEKLLPLATLGWEFISTGGTAKALRAVGIEVTPIEQVTGFPEMLDGRVKTLHPNIFGGILAARAIPAHLAALVEHHIDLIDLVVVNLYDFKNKPDIEEIDIGGPSLIRAASKNGISTIPVIDPTDYEWVVASLTVTGAISEDQRERLVIKVFAATSDYDRMITKWMRQKKASGQRFLTPQVKHG